MRRVSSMAKTSADKFCNVAWGLVTASAADALTFQQIMFGVGLLQGVAMVLHRVLYYPVLTTARQLVAATDDLRMAITTSNRLADIVDISDPSIVDVHRIMCIAANVEHIDVPITHDFTGLPGGGKLIPCNPIYLAVDSGGFAIAANVRAKLEFTFMELADKDYLELLQSVYPANIS
jgi:hypothetical protein